MIPGETIASGAQPYCCDKDKPLKLQVCHSADGYYICTMCDQCGPYSRESDYYNTLSQAKKALDSGEFGRQMQVSVSPCGEMADTGDFYGSKLTQAECSKGNLGSRIAQIR